MSLARVFGRPFGPIAGDRPWATCRAVQLLLVALVVLPPLAHIRLHDPLWVAGIYDEADFDEVVAVLGSEMGLVGDPGCPSGIPIVVLVANLSAGPDVALAVVHSTCSVRAPPG